MNSDNQGNDGFGGAVLIGGAILTCALGSIFLRGLKVFFDQLAITFNSFGAMASSFAGMLLWLGLLILTVAATIAGVYCAYYFAKKFIQVVKEGTELRDAFFVKTGELTLQAESNRERLERYVRQQIHHMEYKLEEALKEPEVSPETQESEVPDAAEEFGVEPDETEEDAETDEEVEEGSIEEGTQSNSMNSY